MYVVVLYMMKGRMVKISTVVKYLKGCSHCLMICD